MDTAEKQQGQESEAVIVCYAYDARILACETQFCYSLPRINVAVTR